MRRERERRRAGAPGPRGTTQDAARARSTGWASTRRLRASSRYLGWARGASVGPGGRNRAEATQIAHARTLPGWHSPAGRQAERKALLLSVPPWAVQPVSILPAPSTALCLSFSSSFTALTGHRRSRSLHSGLSVSSHLPSLATSTPIPPGSLGSTGITSF